MLQATRTPAVKFVHKVGVAPSTTTMHISGAAAHAATPDMLARIQEGCCDDCSCPGCSACTPVNIARANAQVAHAQHYDPYATPATMKGNGFGLINESDAWLTGRPWGLPGTAAVQFQQGANGHMQATLRGADGSAMPINNDDTNAALWVIAGAQRSAQKSLHSIAWWTSLLGGLTVGTVAAAIVAGVVARRRGV